MCCHLVLLMLVGVALRAQSRSLATDDSVCLQMGSATICSQPKHMSTPGLQLVPGRLGLPGCTLQLQMLKALKSLLPVEACPGLPG